MSMENKKKEDLDENGHPHLREISPSEAEAPQGNETMNKTPSNFERVSSI